MSREQYIQQTLTLPAELPLFNYNINFQGLRKILEGVNIKTNANEEEMKKLNSNLDTKLPISKHTDLQKKLNSSYLFGTNCQKYIDDKQQKILKAQRTNINDLEPIDQFCWKMNRMAELVEYLYVKCSDSQQKLSNDTKKYEKLIDESFRRLEDKLHSGTQSMNKTINNYFGQTNDKISSLQTNLKLFTNSTSTKMGEIESGLTKRVSQASLKTALEGLEIKIKKQLQSTFRNDHMERLGTTNQIKNSFKQVEKDLDLKMKSMTYKMQELSEKTNKALQTNAFEIQKHKIFDKISELKSRADDLTRKNNEFVDFRKSYLINNEKSKQQIIEINEQIKKMQSKDASFSKLENMSDILTSLNPHLICEIGSEVKLHEKQIGKLEKQLMALQNQLANRSNQKPVAQPNISQNSDFIQKLIKQYMSNMDFDGRVKRAEKEIYQMKKRNDTFSEIQKKIYMLSKEIDVPAIMKEIKKKCDEQNTRRDNRILDGKIQQLFEFYKQIRREIDQKKKNVSKNDPFENASLTTKKLISPNCISCSPSASSARKNYSKNKFDMSLDYGLEVQRNTIYSRVAK